MIVLVSLLIQQLFENCLLVFIKHFVLLPSSRAICGGNYNLILPVEGRALMGVNVKVKLFGSVAYNESQKSLYLAKKAGSVFVTDATGLGESAVFHSEMRYPLLSTNQILVKPSLGAILPGFLIFVMDHFRVLSGLGANLSRVIWTS